MKTITVNGYTGRETDDELTRLYDENARRNNALAAGIEGKFVELMEAWLDLHFASFGAAQYHNAIAGPAEKYTALRRTIAPMIRATDDTWAELDKRTTTAWHAAHHRYVLAATTARDQLAALVEAANEVHAAGTTDFKYVTRAVYERMVAPEDRQPVEIPDLNEVRAELDGFVETNRDRFRLAGYTLAGAIPAGFEAPAAPAVAEEVQYAGRW